ncbi:MAG: S-layer homology domain-containing protein [Clostridia bacterium]|nr:S-layer homology domain-containing protein [Clostridia bacterium]
MRKIILAAAFISAFLLSTAFAADIDVTLNFNNQTNSVKVSGAAKTIKNNTALTLTVTGPDGSIVFADQTKASDAADVSAGFEFAEMPFSINSPGGVYSFAVSGYKLENAELKTFNYTDGETLLELMNGLKNAADGASYVVINSDALAIDGSLCTSLGEKGRAVFTQLMKKTSYVLPPACETQQQYDQLQQSAARLRDEYMGFIAIAAFNDIVSTGMMKEWLSGYADMYGINIDDAATAVDESKLYEYVDNSKDKTQLVNGLIVSQITTMEELKGRLYEKALLAAVETEHYSETLIILRDYADIIGYNKTSFAKLTDNERISIYNSVTGKSYSSYADLALAVDKLINEKLNSSNSGGGNGGGGGSSGRKRNSTGVGALAESDVTNTVSKNKFSDVPDGFWAEEAIDFLTEYGMASGKGDGKFYPEDYITRAEFIKLVVNAVGIKNSDSAEEFSDVSRDAWYAPYVYAAKAAGIANGDYKNCFNPNQYISREDMAVILFRAYGIESDYDTLEFADSGDISEYAGSAVAYFSRVGIINSMGNGLFAPKANATRAQAAKMIYETVLKYSQDINA